MKFVFEGEEVAGNKIGYVGTKSQFHNFLTSNKSEIEEIITDRLEEKEIYQWDELDIELKVSNSGAAEIKHIVLIGDSFIQEESFEEDMLVRSVKGTIFCVSEVDIIPV